MTPQTPQNPSPVQDSHLSKHGPKYIIAAVVAALVQVLNMTGALAPIYCQFTKNPDLCLKVGQAAAATGQELGKLKLEDGTDMPFETVDGGDQ